LDKIPRGVFVIELIGGGKRIRTTIDKGMLKLTNQITENGLILHVLDKNNRILSDKDTSVVIEDHFFTPDEKTAKFAYLFHTGTTIHIQKKKKKIPNQAPLPSLPHASFVGGPLWQRYVCWLVEMVELVIKPALGMVQW